MHRFLKFRCNLLLLFLLLFYISSANAIDCRQSEAVKRVKRQTGELSSQQHYQQAQRAESVLPCNHFFQISFSKTSKTRLTRIMHEQRSSQTHSIYQPKVKFFTATPAQQVQQQQVNSGTRQRIVFTVQQQQSSLPVVNPQQQQFQLQQQQKQLTASIASLAQSSNYQQYFQQNHHQQQQQVYNITNFPRISQQLHQQQQKFQTQASQQFLQSQQQQLQFYKPQTTTVTHQNVQRHIANQQPTSYQSQPPSQPQQQSTPIPIPSNGPVAPIFSPLLPSYLDDDDMSLNYTRSCDMCCTPNQSPCQNCCDTNPLLSATVLKSSAG